MNNNIKYFKYDKLSQNVAFLCVLQDKFQTPEIYKLGLEHRNIHIRTLIMLFIMRHESYLKDFLLFQKIF